MPGEKGIIAVTFQAPGRYSICVFHEYRKFGSIICFPQSFKHIGHGKLERIVTMVHGVQD
jgi:hypothetical protein